MSAGFIKHENLDTYAAGIRKRYQQSVVSTARMIYAHKYGDKEARRACLYWTAAFIQAAQRYGIRAILQAGSAQFQFRDDDGHSVTHFSYMFDKDEATKRLYVGLWPEMHVWSGIPKTGEIVDLTTCYQPEQAKELAGLIWTPDYAMPDYFWRNGVDNDRFRYHVDSNATLLALMNL